MEYAVIKVGNKQYMVSQGDIIDVDRLFSKENGEVFFDHISLFVSDGKVLIGKPKVPNIRVMAKILEQKKAKKIRVAKFKAKARYRRVRGFRSLLTRIQITGIQSEKKVTTSKEKPTTRIKTSKPLIKKVVSAPKKTS